MPLIPWIVLKQYDKSSRSRKKRQKPDAFARQAIPAWRVFRVYILKQLLTQLYAPEI